MKISSAKFIKSAFSKRHWVDSALPEIAFLGRSNVGKSSLLNSLLQRKALARTSNTPGRTQSINYFLVNDSFYFVDLPGYGYARVSKAMRADWGEMVEDYLTDRKGLVLSIQLVDSRHDPTSLDLQLNEWLTANAMNHIVVATKSDKSSANQLQKRLRDMQTTLPHSKILLFSASTGRGRDQLWAEIENGIKKI